MPEGLRLFVGSINRGSPYFQGARGVGITMFSFDQESGAFEKLSEASDIDNPTFLAIDPKRRCLYAVSEVFEWKEGTVSAYRFESDDLVYVNKQPSLGNIAAYASVDLTGRFVFVSNYGMVEGGPDQSVAVLEIRGDGGLTPAIATVAHAGSGVHPKRQTRPHPHCVRQSPYGGAILVTDLGIDQLVSYRLDAERKLTRLGTFTFAPGAGPRHMAFHPTLPVVFVINELNSTICALRIDKDGGAFTLIDLVRAIPDDHLGSDHCADILMAPDGRFVYSSDRVRNIMSVFAVDPSSGKLRCVEHVACGGDSPRSLAITPNGQLLLVANNYSDTIAIFRRSTMEGTLRDTGRRIAVGTPTCVKFAALL